MIDAGAPYSNDDVGLLWGTSYLFPKDLQDFTNKATVDGNTVSDCSELRLRLRAVSWWAHTIYVEQKPDLRGLSRGW